MAISASLPVADAQPRQKLVHEARSGAREMAAEGAARRRRFARSLGALLLLLVALAPAVAWIQYQARYVTSTNAAVRGHIADLGSRLDGVVDSVEVDVGDRVAAGDVLLRLEDRQLLAEVHEVEAELMGLIQALEVERLAIDHERRRIAQQQNEADAVLTAAEAQVAGARIRADDAARLHSLRQSLLVDSGAISREDVHAADTARLMAEAQFREASARHSAAQAAGDALGLATEALSIRERRLGVMEADVLRAEARLARAEADLASVEITAPDSGAILRRIAQPGTSVVSGQPLISMQLGEELWVEAWVDEDDIGAVRLGGEVTVTLRSFTDREFLGVVDRIGLATDFEIPEEEVPLPRFSRMRGAPVVGIRIRLQNPPADLVPGMSARVAIRKSPG